MKVLGEAPAPRTDRYASALLHDEPNLRVVAFRLEPGQLVPAHTSPSSVLVHVIAGQGTFTGAGATAVLTVGQSAAYEPHEPHSIAAGAEPLEFLAIIAPRPG